MSVTLYCPAPACNKIYKKDKEDSLYSHWHRKHKETLGDFRKAKEEREEEQRVVNEGK